MASCVFTVEEDELSIHYVIRCETHDDHFKSQDPDQIRIWQRHHLELQSLNNSGDFDSTLLVVGLAFIMIALAVVYLLI